MRLKRTHRTHSVCGPAVGLLVAILLLSSCAARQDVPAGTLDDKGSVISLRYGWPNGLQGTMSSRVVRRRTGVPDPENYVVSGRCRFRVEDRSEGQRVHFERCTASVDGLSDERLTAWRSLLERLAAIDQSYLVSPKGELVGVEGIAEVRRALDAWLEERARTQTTNPEAVSLIRDTLFSEERLTAQAAEEWNAMVAIWADADLSLGETYGARIEQPVPMLPDKQMPMDITIAVTRRAACRAEEAETRCVEMTFSSSPDPTAASELTKILAQQITNANREGAAIEPQGQLERIEIRHRIQLLTEPDRLIPHRVERIKDMRIWIRSPDKQTEPIVQVEEFVQQFDYEHGR